MTANERPATAALLDLQPHPEGGWYRQTWHSEISVHPAGYPGPRPTATCIYFLLTAEDESAWHAVRSAELWLWHSGGPLHLTMGGTGDTPSDHTSTVVLGPDLKSGQQPQAVVPAGVWQRAKPAGCDEVLVSTIVSPGFDFADFRMLES
jgi:uncharacterized protein